MRLIRSLALLVICATQIEAFVAPQPQRCVSPLVLHSTPEDEPTESKKGGLEAGVKNKLLAETIAPWRSVRLFLYGALGSGAFVGGMITLTGVAAALSGARSDLDLGVEYKNLAIDFGAVAAFAFLAKFDFDKQQELSERVEEKANRKKEQKVVAKQMQEREKRMSQLLVEIQVSDDGETKEAPIGQVQAGARQHMIIVAGPRKAITEALVGANLLQMDFSMQNVLVVPYRTDDKKDDRERPSGGFGDQSSYQTKPYIARPTGDGWDEYIAEEMEDAVKQAGENVKKEGIAMVVAYNGKVIRRGVGTVPWRKMVDELEIAITPDAKDKKEAVDYIFDP